MKGFVFTMQDVDGNETLYWSNDDGWATKDVATVFHEGDYRYAPMGATGKEAPEKATQ